MEEVKQILVDERGINPRSRDLVTDIITRLAEQVHSAETSRDVVVRELVTLRERLQVTRTPCCLAENNPFCFFKSISRTNLIKFILHLTLKRRFIFIKDYTMSFVLKSL